MASLKMEKALHNLRDGKITFDEFVKHTHSQWKDLAVRLYRRWTPPTGYSVEDTTQDLLLAAWPLVEKWDPTRGVPLSRYVVWNACDKAKKRLHVQRGCLRSGSVDKNPTRGEVVAKGTYHREPWVVPGESRYEREQVARDLSLTSSSEATAMILTELAVELDWEGVALKIYADPLTRLRYRLGNEAQARALVRKVITDTATRVAANAA